MTSNNHADSRVGLMHEARPLPLSHRVATAASSAGGSTCTVASTATVTPKHPDSLRRPGASTAPPASAPLRLPRRYPLPGPLLDLALGPTRTPECIRCERGLIKHSHPRQIAAPRLVAIDFPDCKFKSPAVTPDDLSRVHRRAGHPMSRRPAAADSPCCLPSPGVSRASSLRAKKPTRITLDDIWQERTGQAGGKKCGDAVRRRRPAPEAAIGLLALGLPGCSQEAERCFRNQLLALVPNLPPC